jgi:hypothetical protein
LVLQNIEDRVVQRAIVTILQPLLDPLFDERSFGFRPQRGSLHALAHVERLTLDERRRVWVLEDLRDAFLHVPLQRLLQVVGKFLPAADLIGLIERVLSGNELSGLRQGGPLSPLLLNLYLHHFLDRPWRRDQPRLPLVRVADDLLVLCRTETEARQAHGELIRRLRPSGMPLKGTVDLAIHDLNAGTSASWLGFSFLKPRRGLAIGIEERSWDELAQRLAFAHSTDRAAQLANQIVHGWLGQKGPCYLGSDRDEVCRRITAIAGEQAFDEIPGTAELKGLWQRAYARWCRLRIPSQARRGQPNNGT